MNAGPTDPLLRVTRLLLFLAMALFAIVCVGALAALPPLWFLSGQVTGWLVAHSDGNAVGPDAVLAVGVLLVGIATLNGLTVLFLRKLIALIDSVGQGSPFIPENAARLRAMGWLSVAMQALALLPVPAIGWFRHALGSRHFFIPFSLAGLITALLLFILARVFEQGTRLAEDIEGTV